VVLSCGKNICGRKDFMMKFHHHPLRSFLSIMTLNGVLLSGEIKSFKAPGFQRLKLNSPFYHLSREEKAPEKRDKKRSTYLFKDILNVKDSCLEAYKDGYLELNTIFIILLLYLLTV
jgi:hypothetical protein